MGKIKMEAKIIRQDEIATDIYSMVIQAPEIASQAVPGQFIDVYSADGSKLLPRPISICEIDKENGRLRVVYRVTGPKTGTEEFSKLKAGDIIPVIGPLGNGFPYEKAEGKKVFLMGGGIGVPPMLTSDNTITILGPLGNGFTKKDKKAILIGGGIGIPPMLQLAKELTCEKSIVLGFRDEEFLSEEFEPYGTVYKSSDNGAIGVKGTVMDAIRQYGIEGTEIYACGPTPMLRAIQSYALEHGIEAQLSLEERMACGVGACLACVCKSKEIDDHSQVKNKRVCKDGPVFYAEEVEL